MKNFLYIAQARLEVGKCKIGITDNLDRRLKEYNSATGHSIENSWEYLFACEMKNAKKVEDDIKVEFEDWREKDNKEVYSYTPGFFKRYVNFIKSHKLFKKEVFIKKKEEPTQITKIVTRTKPSLEERGLSTIDIVNKAKRVQNDEFYTRYEDVEKELSMYDKKIWKNKTILCNCDDALEPGNRNNTSAFSQYFVDNFLKLKLKKLICIHYSGQPRAALHACPLFVGTLNDKLVIQSDCQKQSPKEQPAAVRIYTGDKWHDRKDCPPDYDGSFDHPLSLKILNEEADIVCTNPPFSRMKDYWKTVIESGKKFIIISNVANVVTTFYIPYFKNKQVWPGYDEIHWFEDPKRQLTRAPGAWFTNVPIKDRPRHQYLKIMPLKKIPQQYKEYDDAKVLIVKNSYIPSDYKKPFAVSVNPILNGLLEKGYEIVDDKSYRPCINGKKAYSKVLVQICQNTPAPDGIY